jgi:hypothetical protein
VVVVIVAIATDETIMPSSSYFVEIVYETSSSRNFDSSDENEAWL